MNIGEKISIYKERLGFKNYGEFGKAVGIPGNWVNELSKKEEIKQINDMGYLIKLCDYLGIAINQLIINDNGKIDDYESIDITNINEECDDIGILINKIVTLLDKPNIKMDGMLLNNKAKQICKDALEVVKALTRQHL